MREVDNAIATGEVTPAGGAAAPGGAAARGGAAAPAEPAAPRGGRAPGVALGALGILGFSFSLPATRLAVADPDPRLAPVRRPRPVARRVRPRDRRGRPRRRLPRRHPCAAADPRPAPFARDRRRRGR